MSEKDGHALWDFTELLDKYVEFFPRSKEYMILFKVELFFLCTKKLWINILLFHDIS